MRCFFYTLLAWLHATVASARSMAAQDGYSSVISPRGQCASQSFRSVVYFVNWAIYARNYNPQDLPADKLTHVLYAFANVDPENGAVNLTDSWSDVEKHFPGDSRDDTGQNVYGCVKQLFLLKKRHRNLKVLLSVGGWTYSANFARPAGSEAGRAKFAESATQLVLDLGFDGLDIDWEYPKDGDEARNFAALLQAARQSLDRAAGPKRRFLLSAAVSAGPDHYRRLQLSEMTPHLDFYTLMAYDYAGSWSGAAAHQANLAGSTENPTSTPFSTLAALEYYIEVGNVPASKMVLGMPLYGRAFANTDGPGTPFHGSGEGGSWEDGIWDYKALPRDGAEDQFESAGVRGAPGASWSYDSEKRLMVSYDTVPMVREKAQHIIKSRLGGAAWWEASGDRDQGRGGLIGTFVEEIGASALERSDNVLDYPESRYDNIKT